MRHCFACLSRMKFIKRWGLMHNDSARARGLQHAQAPPHPPREPASVGVRPQPREVPPYTDIYTMCYHRSVAGEVSTEETVMAQQIKVIVEKHADGYVAYPLGLKGVVVGEGDTYE